MPTNFNLEATTRLRAPQDFHLARRYALVEACTTLGASDGSHSVAPGFILADTFQFLQFGNLYLEFLNLGDLTVVDGLMILICCVPIWC